MVASAIFHHQDRVKFLKCNSNVCRAALEDPEQMRRMMAPESLQAMLSMAQQLEQLGLGQGMPGMPSTTLSPTSQLLRHLPPCLLAMRESRGPCKAINAALWLV